MNKLLLTFITVCVNCTQMGTLEEAINRVKTSDEIVIKPLPFALNGLEPVMSQKQLDTHYNKHHKSYVKNLNNAIKEAEAALKEGDTEKYIDLADTISFNGGGHYNHEFFWDGLTPIKEGGGELPDKNSALYKLLKKSFGSFEDFISLFNKKAGSIQGSGWGLLYFNNVSGLLEIHTTYNQNRIVSTTLVPLLNIDVWEHAYYIDHLNSRPGFLSKVWQIVNWKVVEQRLEEAEKAIKKDL